MNSAVLSMRANPLLLPVLSRHDTQAINALLAVGAGRCVDCSGSKWSFGVEYPQASDTGGPLVITFNLGEGRLALASSAALFNHGLVQLTGCEDLPELPETLALAVLEALLQHLAGFIRQATGHSLQLTAANFAGELPGLPHRFAWWSENGAGERLRGLLVCDSLVVSLLAEALALAEPLPAVTAPFCLDLPLIVRMELGSVPLSWEELYSLGAGDVLLPDETCSIERLRLSMENRPLFVSRLEGTRLILLEPVSAMTNMIIPENSEGMDGQATSLDSLPIRLCFDLGDLSMSFAELQRLRPGQTVELGRELKRAVRLRVNGVNIGEGTLVDIEGHLGVMIVNLSPTRAE